MVAGTPVTVVTEDAGDPAHTSGTWSISTKAPSRFPKCGLDPGPAGPDIEAGGAVLPAHPDEGDVVDLVLGALLGAAGDRGLELAREVLELRVANEPLVRRQEGGRGVEQFPASTPASGQPIMVRGQSPHASQVVRPTPSIASKIRGTSSMRIQWSWMFWRSVTSATSRPKRSETQAIVRSCSLSGGRRQDGSAS